MAQRYCEKPCAAPPHPDLLARMRNEMAKAQGTAQQAVLQDKARLLMGGERKIPGLNDGMIFPKSHFDKPTSIMAMTAAALERAPLRGAIKVAVVLADFKDVKMKAGVKERMKELFFSTGKIATGSVTEYFSEVSRGKISLTGEVVGPFTLKETMAYYANNGYGRTWATPNSPTMADEALSLANGSINFKPYDNDGNGMVDAYVVVHAGRAAEETGLVTDLWSVKWTLPEEREVDNVKVFAFLTIPEDAGCGICAHELGHLLFGWPDLYDTDYTSNGLGHWCLMSFGNWLGSGNRPCHPSAWCKQNQNWIETVVETENRQITVQDVKSGYKAHRLWTNGDTSSQEYYLIENRQLTGFDDALPGAGLLIWHIDDVYSDNTDENHPKIKLMEADGLEELKKAWDRGDAGDPFPGLSGNTTFNATSVPNSKAYSGQDTFVSVTKIPSPSASIKVDITVKPIVEPPKGPFDSKTWYRLKNTFSPASYSLDVINDNGTNSTGHLEMARDGNFSGQFWQIKSNDDGTYHIRSLFLGPNRQLDISVNDKTKPVLANAGFFSGQFWIIKPWGDGTWHLENAFTGPDRYLDTMEGGPKVAMNSANIGRPTQRWTITPIRGITEAGF